MIYKKTWLSYLLWAAFACITGVMLANYAILFWKKEINADVGYYTVGFVFFIFAAVIGCCFLIRKLCLSWTSGHRINERTAFLWEIFAVLNIFAVGTLYRVFLCLQHNTEQVAATQYYHLATVKDTGSADQIVHGVSHLYTLCLSFVLSFLGNKLIAAVWMQIFIQMLTMLLAYFAVRKLAGRIPACTAMVSLAVSSVYTGQIFSITPECLFFLLYTAGLFVIGSYVRHYCSRPFHSVRAFAGALFLGIIIGAMVYLDALSLTLFIPFIGVITGIRSIENQDAEKKELPPLRFSILLFFFTIVSSIGILMAMFAIDGYMSGAKIESIMDAWSSLYQTRFSVKHVLYQTESSMVECFILVFVAAFLIMSFWGGKKTQNVTPWICLMLLLAPTPLTATGVLSYQIFSIFIWSVLAGIGLQQSLMTDRDEMVKAGTVATEGTVEESVEDAGGSEAVDTELRKESIEQTENPSSSEPAKPRFLENPLPLPKKHERREMDYQYEVAEDRMKFDIEPKEEDDFEIN